MKKGRSSRAAHGLFRVARALPESLHPAPLDVICRQQDDAQDYAVKHITQEKFIHPCASVVFADRRASP
jgi:hypothetical protein